MIVLIQVIEMLFALYLILMFIRIVSSWFPKVAHHPLMRYVGMAVDPYLNIFRTLIPPIGGVLDLSPILGYLLLRLVENLLVRAILQFS